MMNIRHADHTDNVPRKLELLKTAYDAGRFDLAMSLAESIKDTLQFERQTRRGVDEPRISADTFTPVNQLPPALSRWARGWSFCKPVTLFETVGIARTAEPVDLSVGF